MNRVARSPETNEQQQINTSSSIRKLSATILVNSRSKSSREHFPASPSITCRQKSPNMRQPQIRSESAVTCGSQKKPRTAATFPGLNRRPLGPLPRRR
ncbi:hypothetical protein L596_011390 [Steinernema carpocapsae]|uniref:Uncharacterized protein n=1 Tax=Steinernema carpocapsae TaxID=34508 RepID=A0A4U5NU63_STECR|nr:hypothetical protein L596_011390 [Steinernema carpocapsae]